MPREQHPNNPEQGELAFMEQDSPRFDFAMRVIERSRIDLKELKEKVSQAEARQTEFISSMAQDLTAEGKRILNLSKDYTKNNFEKGFNQLGCVIEGDQGTVTKGLQFDGKIGDVSTCAERRGMLNFNREKKADEKAKYISAARSDDKVPDGRPLSYTESVGPCALCRDTINSSNSDAEIIQPVAGSVKSIRAAFLYPNGRLLRGEKDDDSELKAYRELLLDIAKGFPLTQEDLGVIEKTTHMLQESEIDDPIAVSAQGFKGQLYSNVTKKLRRNPQSLIIDKPVEYQPVAEATENLDQLTTLTVMKIGQDGKPKLTMPYGVTRELVRQFHPFTSVMVDFGPDGYAKLPIEIIYPMVYKLRKRKNSH